VISSPAASAITVAGHPPAVRCVSTDGIKKSDRCEFWRANTVPVFGPLQVELLENHVLDGSFQFTTVSDLIFSRLESRTPHRVVLSGASALRSRGFVKAVLLTGGRGILQQNGRTAVLRPGEWSIYDTASPYSITCPDRSEMLLVLIPRERLLARSLDLPNLVARRFSGRRGLGKLIWNLISNTFDEIPRIGRRSNHDVANIVVQMTRMALIDFSGERPSAQAKEVLRDRIKAYIDDHLSDSDLSIARLAGVTGCTKRYLHMIFQSEDVSISDYILKLRLDRCREDLLNPACAHRSITDIAYSWGFNNSNHFSRCFKRAFGVAPRHTRSEFAPWTVPNPEKHFKLL
jgi:AraC-like DNA-binding protein